MAESLEVTFDDRPFQRLVREFPQIVNAETNRAYSQVAGGFMKDFAKRRLRPGIWNIGARRGSFDHKLKGQPNIGRKARKAGFKAVISGKKELEGKSLSIRTRNPLAIMRERGDVIRPRKSDKLYIRGDFVEARTATGRRRTQKKGQLLVENAAARTAALRRRNNPRANASFGRAGRPIVAVTEGPIGPFPRLGFKRLWAAWQRSRAPEILARIPRRSVQRAELKLRREASRRSSRAA